MNMIAYIAAAILLCMASPGKAGDWGPDTNRVYVLTLQPTSTVYQLTARDLNWNKSLITNLKVEEWLKERGNWMATFLLTNHKCVLNSNEQMRVYVKSDDTNTLVVTASDGDDSPAFVVDLKRRIVFSQCGWSVHRGPSGNFITTLGQYGRIGGVQVGDCGRDPSTGKIVRGLTEPIFGPNVIRWW